MSKANRVPLLSKNKTISDGVVKSPDSWNKLEQVENYVENIDLPGLNTETGDVFSILTAVPSPWARGYMMNSALVRPYFTDVFQKSGVCKDDLDGMDTLYSALQNEWKGLVAAIALYGSRIEIEKIVLEYTDDLNYDETTEANILKDVENVYQIKGAFGNMLFNEARVWADRNRSNKEYNPPYFQLIKLDGTLIGATNPKSLVYPAAGYKKIEDSLIPFFKRGRFTDPLHHLKPEELDKLYHYVGKVKKNLEKYDKLFTKSEVNTINLKVFLSEWRQEIKKYIAFKHQDYSLRKIGVLDYFQEFKAPFDGVFNVDMKIYKHEGKYLTKNVTGNLPELNPDQLLLDTQTTELILLQKDNFNDYLSTAMSASCDDGHKYVFSFPLSPLGLSEFYSNLNTLLDYGKGDKNIKAKYFKETNDVEVSLEVEIDGQMTPFSKRYKVRNIENPLDTNVILWPNFIAPSWSNYYMYSELVHNDKDLKAIPLISDKSDYEQLLFDNKEKTQLYYLTEDIDGRDNYHKRKSKALLKINYDRERLKECELKYEIYYSDVPFKGIELRANNGSYTDFNCGYILLDNTKVDDKKGIMNLERKELAQVDVGIDFGSTNTTISYRNRDNDQSIMTLNNRRRFLLGKEGNDNLNFAEAHELFFFQNDAQDKYVRSALLLNNNFRLNTPDLAASEEITGGFPVFENNLNITSGDDEEINLIINGQNETLLHDLKWRRLDQHIKNKKAFLKMLWLYLNAELFSSGYKPTGFSWSYPTSMPMDVRKSLEGIYREMLKKIQPIKGNITDMANINDDENESIHVMSESKAVSNYALAGGGVSVSTDSIMIGFDIGGMTSDMFILINDPGDARATLVRQTSAKLAANRLSKAVGMSTDLQKCISHFSDSNSLGIKSLSNFKSDASMFLLNILFDIIENDPALEKAFYDQCWNPDNDQLNRSETRGMLAIASYISGLLLFHAGQKVRSLLENKELNLKTYNIKFAHYGKGGKLFNWLPSGLNELEAEKYYEDCFKLGASMPGESLEDVNFVKSFNDFSVNTENKQEVALGLITPLSRLVNGKNMQSEIIGEVGYTFNGKEMKWNDVITPDMIFEFGEKLEFPTDSELSRFRLFMTRYLTVVQDWDIFKVGSIKKDIDLFAERKLENYVKKDEDWIANSHQRFETDEDGFKHTASPFLYQGMCFLDEILIPKLYPKAQKK